MLLLTDQREIVHPAMRLGGSLALPATPPARRRPKPVNQIRQGDVLLTRIAAPKRAVRVLDQTGQPMAGLLVAGERTGHAHRLPARVYDTRRGRVLMLERPETITHEEHAHLTVPAGWWQVNLQTEYRPQARPRRRSIVD